MTRNRRFTRPFAALLLFCIAAVSAADETRLKALAKGTAATARLSGLQVSLLRNGQAAESYAFGFAQRHHDGEVPLRREHKVRIASISKLVVAIGVMQLVDAGKLDLDADVSEYLEWPLRNPAWPDTPITARQLLSHTSSIRDGAAYFIAAGEGELRDFFTPGSPYWDEGSHFADEPAQAPGDYFAYSNLNFGVLATLIELLSGERFDQYMARHVLDPLGLNARFDPCEVPGELRAAGFRKGDQPGGWTAGADWLAQVDGAEPRCFYGMDNLESAANYLAHYPLGSNATIYSPQGGLRASADDLVKVLQVIIHRGEISGKQILSADAVDAMLEANWTIDPQRGNGLSAGEAEPGGPTDGLMTSYGLSVHRIDMRDWGFTQGPELLIGHLGEAYGVLSHALVDPVTGHGIVAIITGSAEDPARATPGSSPLYRIEEEILRWWLAEYY